jgi:hydrogenase-4 component B
MNVAHHAGFLAVSLLLLAVVSVGFARFRSGSSIVYAAACVVSALAALSSMVALARGMPLQATLPLGLPGTGMRLELDALSAVFSIIVNLGVALASLYAVGYARSDPNPGRVLPFYCLFLLGMNLVLVADDAFTFLLSWEFMSLSSWALVVSRHEEKKNRDAGFLYLLMASFGTLSLLFAFGLLAGETGGYAFDAMRERGLSPLLASLAFLLVLIGAGSKAGLAPLHVWLPPAHSAAPSHVSALMSGVMTKVAVYGFIRIAFDLLGEPVWWWGTLVLLLGGVTAVLGALFALMQDDLKRLLAYSSVENIGIVFIGLGLALAFEANGMKLAAAIAATAAIFHCFNHALFKSLLFFGAGAVQHATTTRDLNQLGGLIHRMPATAIAFLVGSVAIASLPPLNGFVSEWLTLQAILLSPEVSDWGLKFAIPAVGVLLALSGALAGAVFVKAFGVAFLGRPRSPAAVNAHETDKFSLAAMGAAATLCVLAGALPGYFVDGFASAVTLMTGTRMPDQSALPWFSLVPVAAERSSYSGLLLLVFLLFAAYGAVIVIHQFVSNAIRRAPPWDCGYPDARPQTQYTASSFAQPVRRVYGALLLRSKDFVFMPPPGDIRAATFRVEMRDLIWEKLYLPVSGGVFRIGQKLQFQSIRRYLALVLGALVLLLTVLAIWL